MSSPEPPGRSRASAIGEGTSAGLLFLAGPLLGYFLGRWMGGRFGWGEAPAWIGGGLGLAAAFVNFFRLAGRLNR
ncbi:MAG: AtpZ/AtpI family protein [Acidobacteria bacterium]|nr:AtpZ/AtpI family protein [Acidobacteriota bacterium]MCA1611140.1 AtpZ/AtpI family protein [Acidobacteriota bacterium]